MKEKLVNRVLRSFAGLGLVMLTASCAQPENTRPSTFLAPVTASEMDRLRRMDFDEVVSSSLKSELTDTSRAIRYMEIEGGVQWNFVLEHIKFGEKQVDPTDLTVTILYDKGVSEGIMSQYIIQATGLAEVGEGDLKKHFKSQENEQSKSSERSLDRTVKSIPGETVERSLEKTTERPTDANLRGAELLKAANKFFILPFNLTNLTATSDSSSVDLIVLRGRGQNSFGWNVDLMINTVGMAEIRVKRP